MVRTVSGFFRGLHPTEKIPQDRSVETSVSYYNPSYKERKKTPSHVSMASQPKYLTGDAEGIKDFIDKFDVSCLFVREKASLGDVFHSI